MIKKIAKAFVIGSSWLVFIPFFYAVRGFDEEQITNYSYHAYSFFAPLYFAIWTCIAVYLSVKFKYPFRYTIFIISILSPFVIMYLIMTQPVYKYNRKRNWKHFAKLVAYHMFAYNAVIGTLYLKL